MTRYIIIGAGAVGASLAAELETQAIPYVLVGRGAQIAHIAKHGLSYRRAAENRIVRLNPADTAAPPPLRRGDVLILAVKAQDVEATTAFWAWREVEGAGFASGLPLVTLQNGLAAEDIALRRFDRVYAASIRIPARYTVIGEVVVGGEPNVGIVALGCYPAGLDDTALSIVADLTKAGYLAEARPDSFVPCSGSSWPTPCPPQSTHRIATSPTTPFHQSSSLPEPVAGSLIERRVSLPQRLWQNAWLRKGLILIFLAIMWEVVARLQGNDLLLPSFAATLRALFDDIGNGIIPGRAANSIDILVKGYVAGVVLAFVLTSLAVSSQLGRDFLSTLTSMLNRCRRSRFYRSGSCGSGWAREALIFVLIHSVLWPLALNTYTGFTSVPETLRMTGRNYGLRGLRYVFLILVPAALPSIIAGLKIGWAFAWRTLIAAELVFGASSGRGGLGWYIFQNRNELYTDRAFAGLMTVILLGLLVENVLFRQLERRTILKWGMTR
ncbi:LOW QUALITY PROTEIN: ABC-type nitrate/sulfonate/bicarbonate transport system, permease component [Rhizobium leguminosarum bv. trifolii WSM2012]|nr:LOW QUALITY PROTEIN: ABC-type nitrate/sulfonate/bicarbonate transport system, permease component [Rhizobium leguminosarum bv. trifolii WSM2012]